VTEPQKIPISAELYRTFGRAFDAESEQIPLLVSYDDETVFIERPDEESKYLAIDLRSLLRAIGESGLSEGA
jgi:hypothetical protein